MSAGPGTVVAGRYELRELIGSGGMGRVWRAVDSRLGRVVAVKEVTPPKGGDPEAPDAAVLSRIAMNEARLAARVVHPHITKIYDVVEYDGMPCLVMEYVPSQTLLCIIDECGPLSRAAVVDIGVALVNALIALHRAGVLHRDVKPGNVLIGHDGRVLLTDFGIAVPDTAEAVPTEVTGTPQYIPPERAVSGLSLPEGDLWSLGATLYSAVEGVSPYLRTSATKTMKAITTTDPRPTERAGALAPILVALMRRDPYQRPTATQVRRQLSLLQRTPKPTRPARHRSVAGLPDWAGIDAVGPRSTEPSIPRAALS